MYLAKVNYKKENVVEVLSLILKDIINENTVEIGRASCRERV